LSDAPRSVRPDQEERMSSYAEQFRRVRRACNQARDHLDHASSADRRGDTRARSVHLSAACHAARDAATQCIGWAPDDPLRVEVMLLVVELSLACTRLGQAAEFLPFLAILAASDVAEDESLRQRLSDALAAAVDGETDDGDTAAEAWRWIQHGMPKSAVVEISSRESIYDSSADGEDRYQLLERALESLPEADREVVVQHTYNGRAWDGIARELGVASVEAVKTRYQRAMVQISKELRGFART
jgi:DNA-directed RNA polymerase specialized sigma24 family protein